ncbi:hypothetical protein TWF281_003339 [Arthrobotrys megalospora]
MATPKITISQIFGSSSSSSKSPPKRAASVISSPTLVPLKLQPSPISSTTTIPKTSSSPPSAGVPHHHSTNIQTFQKSLTAAYSSSKPGTTPSTYLWCPVFKQYLPTSLIKHFHIITPNPYYSQAIGHLFGHSKDGESHFTSLTNGMIMAKCIANLIISGDFAIIPVEGYGTGENDLTDTVFRGGATVEVGSPAWEELSLEEQTSLLDIQDMKDLIKNEGDSIIKPPNHLTPTSTITTNNLQSQSPNPGIKLKLVLMKPYNSNHRIEDMDLYYADIHNTLLEFKSSFRPDLRYCYFRYISSMLIWLNLQEAKVFKNAWKPKNKWLRESLVVEMARPERLANWEVYEEIVGGSGLFDDDDDEDGDDDDGERIVRMDNGWKTTKSGEMAAQLEWGLLTSPDYMFPPHGHELQV